MLASAALELLLLLMPLPFLHANILTDLTINFVKLVLVEFVLNLHHFWLWLLL